MNISNNFAARTQMIQTRTAPVGTPQVQNQGQTPPPVKTGPSQKMQNYISKSSASTAEVKSLTGASMVQDIKDRANDLGVSRVQSNAGGVMGWLKQTSIYKFFAGEGDQKAQDTGQTTKLGEAVVDGVGHFSEIAIKGADDTLKLGKKGAEDLQKTTDALHGKTPDEPPDPVSEGDKMASGFGIGTSGIAFLKGAHDAIGAIQEFRECSHLASEAKEKSNQAFAVQGLRVQIGTIAGGNTAAIEDDILVGTPDPHKIDAMVSEVKAVMPHVDVPKLTAALTSKVNGGTEHQEYLSEVGTHLNQTSLSLMDESVSLKKQVSVGRREAGMELAKSVATLTEKGANITSKVLDITSKSATHLAQAAAVTGIASTVVATAEVAINIHAALKASGVKEAMKALRTPTQESLQKAGTAIEKKADALQEKANKLTKPKDAEKKATLMAQVDQLRATATTLKTATPEQVEASKLQSTKLDAAAKQIQKRQGIGAKILNACISGLKVAAGIAATVAVFAGAAALAATPVGWALGAAAIVAGVAMGCYKVHQAYSRYQQNHELKTTHEGVKQEIASTTQSVSDLKSSIQTSKDKIQDLTDRIADAKGKHLESLKPHIARLETQLNNETRSLNTLEHQLNEAELKLPKLLELHKDISIMRCRKDPEYAANQILKNINPDLGPSVTGEKRASRESKKMEAETLVEALGINLDSFKETVKNNPAEAKKQLHEFLNPD